jgi:hypothetical protein
MTDRQIYTNLIQESIVDVLGVPYIPNQGESFYKTLAPSRELKLRPPAKRIFYRYNNTYSNRASASSGGVNIASS